MLIEFSVKNFRSIKDNQSLKLTASKASGLEGNLFDPGVSGVSHLLHSAVIYGPNASGKSNIIQAIRFMREFVLSSAKEGQEGDLINVTPFLFQEDTRNLPCEFEVSFIQDKVRYQYGFSINKNEVKQEWLFAYPKGRTQLWFERVYDDQTQEENWYFGPKFVGRRRILQESTRRNALFLSTAVQLNKKQLRPIFDWFKKLTVIGDNEHLHEGFSIGECEDEEKKRKITKFLATADLSIEDILVEKRKFSLGQLPSDMPQALKDELKKELDGKELIRVKFMHASQDAQEMIPIALEDESTGTQKLFAFAGPWLDLLENGRILFVDELGASLHPLLVRYLLQLIHETNTNKHNAQLIFTTHNTSILSRELFRRDQVWFMEKDKSSASQLYPLSDFSPRKGEALEKGYLEGRYGALPFIGDLEL